MNVSIIIISSVSIPKLKTVKILLAKYFNISFQIKKILNCFIIELEVIK